ncbi:hypothetical protein BHYA_0309g00130 [Botrytis hyacinthi]|uniref:Uncharacterized protein n=1 Tax=Botrytis hyacinthi TaxID=278943 RepID=A0A4Z1G6E7_9HELO|nr:hypothetical protein BHYA_0309g00130 [Botrytis hyacinthi]
MSMHHYLHPEMSMCTPWALPFDLDYADGEKPSPAFECNPEYRADFDLPRDINAKLPRWGCPNNVFQAKNLHRIEENFRNQALLGLEKQYEAINRHALEVNESIKSEKRCGDLLGLAGWKLKTALTKPFNGSAHRESLRDDWWDRSTEALLLLKEYADSFARDLSFQLRIECRKYDIVSSNNHLPRARLLENIKEAYKYRAYNNFVQWFEEAVDDMDGQCIEVKKARQRLSEYEKDEKTKRVIQADYREFGSVNWVVDEPDMRVRLTIDKVRSMRIYDVKEKYYS